MKKQLLFPVCLLLLPLAALADAVVTLAPVTVTDAGDPHGTHLAPFGDAAPHTTPAALADIDREQLERQQTRHLAELTRADAALGDNYAPVGYYQNLAVRGLPLDLASGYRMNGLLRVGEQRLAYENVARVEVLKGLAGMSAGVLEPAGLVNFVSKRPTEVTTLTLAGDREGTALGALDVGHWLTPALGVRVNLARERLGSYVDHADGARNFLSLATDWLASDTTTLAFDADYQASSQRSVSGYQLLGANALPSHADRRLMLGYQAWQQPVDMESFNTGLHLSHDFNDAWQLQLAAGRSQSRLDDNVAFAYGSCLDALCSSSGTPSYHFASNGDFAIYDYRSPDETHRVDDGRLTLNGKFEGVGLQHHLQLGGELARRTLERRREVYDWVGVGNIYTNPQPVLAPSPSQPGPLRKRLDSREQTLFVMDRMEVGEHWQLLAGAKHVALDEHTWTDTGAPDHARHPDKVLPQAAVLWLPNPQLTHYLSYSRGLSLGLTAPWWTHNAGAVLGPRGSNQWELGSKLVLRPDLRLSAALYRLSVDAQFAVPDATPEGFTFADRGRQVHTGIELGLQGKLTPALVANVSVNALRARLVNTGLAGYGRHQAVNAPALRVAAWLDYRLPAVTGLRLDGGLRHVSANTATPTGSVRVPAWTVVDAGLAWRGNWQQRSLTLQLDVLNLFDRFYWRDTGSMLGDSYLFPGAPREIRFALTLEL